jgi:hypothetical protein
MKLLTLTSITLATLASPIHHASASDSVYSFGGACPSQGTWTQAALTQTDNIVAIVAKLKDNPACKGIESVVQDLQSAKEVLKIPNDELAEDHANAESLPGQLDALRRVMVQRGAFEANIANLLFKKTLQTAQMGANAAAAPGMPPIVDGTAAIKALYKRTARTTQMGITTMERVFNVLPMYDTCLMGQPDQGLALMSAAVKIGASFATAGEGVGHRLGGAMASLVTMLRNRNFTKAIRKLNETEFWFSVSCVIETTTKSWCDARNAQDMLQYSQDEYHRTMKGVAKGMSDPNSDNPLEGYYLMVRELPIIAQWLRSVKLGTDPKTSADATFKNDAIESYNEFLKLDNVIRAEFNTQKIIMDGFADDEGKRNTLYEMVVRISDMMLVKKGAGQFFRMSINDAYLPFFLIGLKEIPAECRAVREGGMPAVEWDKWMKSGGPGGKYVPVFDDPVMLSRIVQARMLDLLDRAADRASVFFRQRLVVDLQNLLNLTLTGQYMSVREALQHTLRYLERFEKRLTNSDVDAMLLPSVQQTMSRIRRILESYNEVLRLGRDLKSGTRLSDKDLELRADAAARGLIDTVFDELKVLYQTDVMLTNRLTTFINRDFSMRIRSGKGMSAYQRELLVITQEHLLEKLIEAHGVNPTSAKMDLVNAQVVNKRNLESIEEIFSDTMFNVLEELNQIAHGRPASAQALKMLADERFRRDRAVKRAAVPYMMFPGSFPVPLTGWKGFLDWIVPGRRLKQDHPDLYVRAENGNRVSSGKDDEFGSFTQLWSRLCGQTLAFENRAKFIELCKGSVVKSYYSGKKEHSPLDLTYDDYLNSSAAKAIAADPVKVARRTCAVNDFNIRNLVRYLEDRDQREDGAETTPPPPAEVQKPVTVEPAPVPGPVEPNSTGGTAEPSSSEGDGPTSSSRRSTGSRRVRSAGSPLFGETSSN